jgi:hypothetical protein
MTPDNVLPIASVRCGITSGLKEPRRLETFTGAACCKTIKPQCYKAAPLQGLGPNTSCERTTPIEDEDDDEDENDYEKAWRAGS